MSTPGFFIAVEGGDGAGKGSVIAFLADALRNAGRMVVATREPGGTPEGTALRALLLREGAGWLPEAELLLMVAARVQHVRRVILPALAAGTVVLSDRFAASTLAYQGAGRGLSTEAITGLHAGWVGGMKPDRTLLLDVPPAVGLTRSRTRLRQADLDEGRFEALDAAFHSRVRESFLSQARTENGWMVIDATLPLEDVQRQALAAVNELCGVQPAE